VRDRGRPPAASTRSVVRPRADRGTGHVLIVRTGDRFEARPVTGDEVTIGRDPTCELVIDDDAISRRHARLRFGAAVTIEDLGSRNGTLVAGRRLEAHRPVPLELDQPIAIGDVQLFVDRARPAPAATATDTGDGLIVRDPAMRQLHAALAIVAMSPLRVLLLGETGVGKDVCARALHARSRRADRPLLELNCAALPESTLEAELFGYERGAFTGATAAKPGLLEAADGGTVFLDEVGELSLGTQAKLLRVLERGEVLRLGSLAPTTIDVRVVSATNRDLRALVAAGAFRSDLYFRLNGTTITIPPLRERVEDIEPLARRFAAGMAAQLGRPAPDLAPAAVEALRGYAWPGNLRELKNTIERAVVMTAGRPIAVADLELAGPFTPPTATPAPTERAAAPDGAGLWSEVEVLERARIVDALHASAGNQSAAARRLGIGRATLIKRIEHYGLSRPKKPRGA
jgi:two-component system response regulator AtoC